jgi:hypothetical protein
LNRLLTLLLYLMIGLIPFSVRAQSEIPFAVGEKLTYSAWFNFIQGGTSSLEIIGMEKISGIQTYHVRSLTASNPFFDRFYKVRDQMDSWLDGEGYFSHKFSKSLREGRYRKKYEVEFNYQEGKAISASKISKIPSLTNDGLSMFYYVRTLDLRLGDTIAINCFDNDSLRPFIIKVEKIEMVETPLGEIKCFVLAPDSDTRKLFKQKNQVVIYLSADTRRIPVMISSDARFGSLVLKLESINTR